MSLSDNEILELSELGNAVVEETLTDAQRERLSEWLATSEEARRYYVRTLGLSASLFHYASEMQADAPDALAPRVLFFPTEVWRWAGGLAAAAVVIFGLWFAELGKRAESTGAPGPIEYVARLTGANACKWSDPSAALHPGSRLRKGQRLELKQGFAEVTFDSGAQVVLEGPASLDLNSPWDGTLRRGGLKAYVPPEAIGFRVSNLSVEVVDLGTEFTMIADPSGAADVLVLKGEVEAAPRDPADQDSILLRAKESRRFARSGVSAVGASDGKFARLTQPIAFERFAPAANYVHWLFDEADGNRFRAETLGVTPGNYDLQLRDASPAALARAHPESRWRHALRFDGRLYATAAFPGISGNATHTVAFWVNVPSDAQLTDNYAMVAWGTTAKKLASHPVHISWNRNPGEGPMGALRTDFGGGSAMGMTTLRDGRWHHVAVVFSPGRDGDSAVQVKQYVDGKLESSATNPPGHTARLSASKEESPAKLEDVVWLGCRLGPNGLKKDRFKGQIDELFITDRGLEPNEIVQVMKENRLTPAAVEVARAGPAVGPGF